MVILTKHMSLMATGGAGDAGVADSANESPFLKAFTKLIVVFASGLNAAIIESSQVRAAA
jgi:hypothetical protein